MTGIGDRAAGQSGRGCGFRGEAAHPRVPRLQRPGDSDEGAAGAHRGDPHVHPAAGLLPELAPGAQLVRARVGGVAELIRPERPQALDQLGRARLDRLQVLSGYLAGPRAAGLRHQLHLGPQRAQHPPPLVGIALGHHRDQPIAADRTDEGEAGARVAAGYLDHRRAETEAAVSLRLLDHPQRDAVLDAAPRVRALDLRQHPARQPLGQTVERHQRRRADRAQDAIENAAHPTALRMTPARRRTPVSISAGVAPKDVRESR